MPRLKKEKEVYVIPGIFKKSWKDKIKEICKRRGEFGRNYPAGKFLIDAVGSELKKEGFEIEE